MNNRCIIGISDVSLGYGSPQINRFIQYVKKVCQFDRAIIIEPDQIEKKYVPNRYEGIYIHRIYTEKEIYHGGRGEYIRESAKYINELRPNIVVAFCSFTLPVIFELKYRPQKVIYYNIEMASYYGKVDHFLNHILRGRVDLMIYPEENRAKLDIRDFGDSGIPTKVIYNCTNDRDISGVIDSKKRNGKVIYAGTLDTINTNIYYFWKEREDKLFVDVYGKLSSCHDMDIKRKMGEAGYNVSYEGLVSNKELEQIRRYYAYSVIMWNPINENQFFAAPNKFFEAIADGVVPICAPHPQCKMIIKKYNCGILMDDWSFESFCNALVLAEEIYQTDLYSEMVENCKKAVINELNFEKQMEKIVL